MKAKIPRIVIAGLKSGSGKTLVTLGILKALSNRGLRAAAYKCGPDYIDPMYHRCFTKGKSANLDSFFLKESALKNLLVKTFGDCDIGVIEGVMGYYDGIGGTTVRASTYEIASLTKSPVILLVDGEGMSLSIAALVKGFLEYGGDKRIKAVIINRISPMLYEKIKPRIEEELPVKVLGYVPKMEELVIKSRHLGLVAPKENKALSQKIERLAVILEDTIDLNEMLLLAGQADPVIYEEIKYPVLDNEICIGVAQDKAFSFYYEENRELLRLMGARLCYFSPLGDKALPGGIKGLWLGGGYPERYAAKLSENQSMRESIKAAIGNGMPCIAECGGFLYLHRELESDKGERFPMVGMIDALGYKTDQLKRFGYVELNRDAPSLLGKQLKGFPAHEFHYWDSEDPGEDVSGIKPLNGREYSCIHAKGNLLAGFPHWYLYGHPKAAYAYLKSCEAYEGQMGPKGE